MDAKNALSVVFPPYGYMGEKLEDAADDYVRPIAWPKSEDFNNWLSRMAAMLSDVAWPAWNPVARDWESTPAQTRMLDLTLADFAIMDSMRLRNVKAGDYSAFDAQW